jgi:hypothetical protein
MAIEILRWKFMLYLYILVKSLDYSEILLIWLRRIITALACHIP